MKSASHSEILDTYFWLLVDRGEAPENTPLFIGIYEGESLSLVIARKFQLELQAAESAIEIAKQEVAL
jgi:hypothetical protein